MTTTNERYEIVEGMLAVESPQRSAAHILDLLERGEVERVREIVRQRAARISEALDRELAASDLA